MRLPTTGRLLAIDLGDKRIGVAVSDPTQVLAQPSGALTRRLGKRFPLQQLREHIKKHDPVGIVFGLPLESDGSEGERAREARAVGDAIETVTGLPVEFYDERMTTARALRAVKDLGGGTKGRRGDIDPLAATTLLQSYLESRRA